MLQEIDDLCTTLQQHPSASSSSPAATRGPPESGGGPGRAAAPSSWEPSAGFSSSSSRPGPAMPLSEAKDILRQMAAAPPRRRPRGGMPSPTSSPTNRGLDRRSPEDEIGQESPWHHQWGPPGGGGGGPSSQDEAEGASDSCSLTATVNADEEQEDDLRSLAGFSEMGGGSVAGGSEASSVGPISYCSARPSWSVLNNKVAAVATGERGARSNGSSGGSRRGGGGEAGAPRRSASGVRKPATRASFPRLPDEELRRAVQILTRG